MKHSERLLVAEKRIGYIFKDRKLLEQALIHRSYYNENKEAAAGHNERLEFLGDSVLNLLVADYLYNNYSELPEGELSFLRSRLVDADSCAKYVEKLEIDQALLLGKGEQLSAGRGRKSILADLFEAVIGSIYLDGGLEACRAFLLKMFSDEIAAIVNTPAKNWKALLQDYAQREHQVTPKYVVADESGPDHAKTFLVRVLIREKEFGEGRGSSKKEAQQEAAKNAVEGIDT